MNVLHRILVKLQAMLYIFILGSSHPPGLGLAWGENLEDSPQFAALTKSTKSILIVMFIKRMVKRALAVLDKQVEANDSAKKGKRDQREHIYLYTRRSTPKVIRSLSIRNDLAGIFHY